MPDALSLLPRLSWRGAEYPVSARSMGFSHQSVEHAFQYRDNATIESIGAKNPTFRYTIPFRQGIAKGPYKDLFTKGLPQFHDDCFDSTAGSLRDPVRGFRLAKCVSYLETMDVQKRDGTDVTAEFVYAPLPGDEEAERTVDLPGVTSEAGLLERELEQQPWVEQDNPGVGLVDPLLAIAGLGQQVLASGNKLSAATERVISQLEEVEATFQELADPRNEPLVSSSRTLRDRLIRLRDRSETPARRVLTIVLPYQQTLSIVAMNNNMTLEELLDLNPLLAQWPMVPANAKVRVYG